MKSILLVKKRLGLVEMAFGLVYASFSLPEWQAVKNDFLCTLEFMINTVPPTSNSVHIREKCFKYNNFSITIIQWRSGQGSNFTCGRFRGSALF